AFGLIHESIHYIISLYKKQKNNEVFNNAIKHLSKELTKNQIETIFIKYINEYPVNDIFSKNKTVKSYLNGKTTGVLNREIIIEELILLWLENNNPAFQPFSELFSDSELSENTKYLKIIDELKQYFDSQPPFGPDDQNLIEMLRMPAVVAPDSLQKQLEYIRDRWGYLLGDFLQNILRALDFIYEEKKSHGIGPGEIKIPNYFGEDEYERFSPDREWMPKVVMIAKNVYVWMDQLSKQYQRQIAHLNEIPNEELDKLSGYGFTALWLIGLWERSKASKEIKRMCGNPEAEASAYSLMGYEIANDIGGWDAFHHLQQRCWQHGIRMASDMVPNHTGIDSQWVLKHPDWFLSLNYSPFPSYTFNGKDLSGDGRVGIYIEDKYFSRTDAAVVFKRVDYWTGDEKYIYHGNDGTSMPWNDTAQLDYLNPEVRETVIQTILHVARNFPIVRFDAAMTLAKKHLQRLWYPELGTGSDISSRAEFGLSSNEFNDRIPNEFWREVVDRVATEVPDTLLLAEAFWMMESYFVRTLGMHRVYNSAFMNMLKMERNADYRTTIKKTLEFDPEILKRFVNFLNNPDEETAAKQFGKGDKYFGVTLLMITMPGLPMFGHSQIEGFEEKYGMEYRKAYWNEQPDWGFIERHKYDIFPLMHKRYLFSGVDNFYLYDYYSSSGDVNENVFAYSNQFGNERALVFYNNSYENTAGWVRISSAYIDKTSDSLKQTSIGDGLNLKNVFNHYLILHEHKSGLEYIRRIADIFKEGIYTELNGYQYQIFWNMREVVDNEFSHYAELHNRLAGRGVRSIENELQMQFRQKIDILYVSAEVAPFSKAGGLADVVGALPKEIVKKGQKVAVITPFYSIIDKNKYAIKYSGIKGNIQLGDNHYEYYLYQYTDNKGVDIFFVKNDHFFNRTGIYTDETGEGYTDNFERFLFLQYVVIDLVKRGLFSVNLIHCNDHHTALIPWMLNNRNMRIPLLLTIHNAEYQGWFNFDEAKLLHSIDFENRDKRRKNFNSLTIGIKYCNALNTVSQNYAKELIKKEKLSFGLKKILIAHKNKFSGIINGADYSIWDPQTDPFLKDHFSIKAILGKNKNKRLLLKKCNWKYSTQPVIGMVSRLVTTKGFYLILRSINEIIATGAKLVIIGTGNVKISNALKKAAKKYPNQISFYNYFDEKMAHLIEAGSDMFLMPSRYEPCGLNQIYSLRYGTIPIVFNTGGLADTVANWDGKNGDGFVFYHYTSKELIKTILEVVDLYQDKKAWKKLINNAMKNDYSWSNSAKKYLNLYTQILEEN
ncbi:glycogen/starch synthase, partial [bacterium]|nr:glycogen/starch synthase [bacterium]